MAAGLNLHKYFATSGTYISVVRYSSSLINLPPSALEKFWEPVLGVDKEKKIALKCVLERNLYLNYTKREIATTFNHRALL
jgi:hypothetical protein